MKEFAYNVAGRRSQVDSILSQVKILSHKKLIRGYCHD